MKSDVNQFVLKSCRDYIKMNTEELKSSVLKQIEYYFSDENLIRGKFLRKLIQKNVDGWVHLNVLVTFKRLAKLTTNIRLIGKLLSQSKSNVIEISKDKQRVRRVGDKPLPTKTCDKLAQMISRSAYVEGIPEEMDIDSLIDFFETASNIIIRKYYDKKTNTYKSKGSAFVTFASRAQCDDFVDKKLILHGVELKIMHQEEFISEKASKRKAAIRRKRKQI